MTYPLRTTHFRIWIGIALVLPMTIAYTLVSRSNAAESYKQSSLAIDVKIMEGARETDTLNFSITEVPVSASCGLYVEHQNGSRTFIGSVSRAGFYRFPIPKHLSARIQTIVLYDIIRKNDLWAKKNNRRYLGTWA
jgi:hypothetical protein